MKQTRLLFISLLVAMACSKSDSPAPALESTKVVATTITPPAALTSSSDSHAIAVSGLINSANALTNYTSFFNVAPSGATKSSTVIKASNGRVNNAQGTTVTYTWTDTQSGNMVGYQVTDDGTSYHWEFFYKFASTDLWIKYIDATEKKDGSSGELKVLDAFGISGSDPKAILYKFEWSKTLDLYNFKYTFGTTYFELNYNLTTKAGTADYYLDSVLYAKYTWKGDGSGTWQTFNPIASGTW